MLHSIPVWFYQDPPSCGLNVWRFEVFGREAVNAAGLRESLALLGVNREQVDAFLKTVRGLSGVEVGARRFDTFPAPVVEALPYPCHCGGVAFARGNGVEDICDACYLRWMTAGYPAVCPCGVPSASVEPVRAILECCATGHPNGERSSGVADWRIIPACRAALGYIDYAASPVGYGSYGQAGRRERMLAAADRLRDFMTVELLCDGLGVLSPRSERRARRVEVAS